jgi:hypothetical protein
MVKDGSNGDPHSVGPGRDSEASEWIIQVLDRPDPRPVWFTIWGGPRELAQAIWKVSQTRTPEQLAAFKRKIRVHSIADQDKTAEWVKKHHPDVFWIFSMCFRGIWKGYDQEIVSQAWLRKHVLENHGPLGPTYPPKAAGKDAVKEGDTPSYFHILPDGLSDPEQPEWGNWGGRFRRSGRGMEYVDATDRWNGRSDKNATIARWRSAYQNAFEARMDWCVQPFDKANHPPLAVLNSDPGRKILTLPANPGGEVNLTAGDSSDPDGDKLAIKWWFYPEPSNCRRPPQITNPNDTNTAVVIPPGASGCSLHIILEVTDNGTPALTSYRRAILKVAGDPVADTAGAPVTELPPPPRNSGPWTFLRGINIGGAPVTIDGNRWHGDDAPDFECSNKKLHSPQVSLIPPCDPERTQMIHSFRWAGKARLRLTKLPPGRLAVFAYLWEETSPETLTISLNGKPVARDLDSGHAGEWQRLGPWITEARHGTLEITSQGGATNFSGIEVWQNHRRLSLLCLSPFVPWVEWRSPKDHCVCLCREPCRDKDHRRTGLSAGHPPGPLPI